MIIRRTSECLIFGLAILPIFLKALLLEGSFRSLMGVDFYGAEEVFQNDSIIYFTMLLCVYCSYLQSSAILGGFLRLLAVAVWVLYSIDLWILANFTTRLTYSDIVTYGSYAPTYLIQSYGTSALIALAAALCLAMLGYIFVRLDRSLRGMFEHAYFLTPLAILGLSATLPNNDSYIHAWAYENFINHNLKIRAVSRPYSEDFAMRVGYEENRSCTIEKPSQKNIVLLMVESLSTYQSDLFSGIRDWTPNLDEIARNNQYFTRFHANGYTTEHGEMALLTGLLPITPPSENIYSTESNFSGFSQYSYSLPRALNQGGYQTEFLTNSDLGFAHTGEWVEGLEFDYIEGHEHPYYDNFDRYQFGAAPDAALYDRVLERISEQASQYFIFVKTTSSHQPHMDPESGKRGEELAFSYVDRQLGEFYDELVAANFFADGVLIIVGDHRAMVPLLREEIALYGPNRASAMVPLIISSGNRRPERRTRSFQQTDIYHAIKKLSIGDSCRSHWIGDPIEDQFHAKYLVHSQGDSRDLVNVFTASQEFAVLLDGDNTRLENPGLIEAEVAKEVVGKINALRIERSSVSAKQ